MSATQEMEHDIAIGAPAGDVYRLLADVTNWPLLFPPTVHVERLERDAGGERIQIWATAGDTAKTWTSRRELDSGALRIEFRQERSSHPVGAMGGTWIVADTGPETCHVRLLHDFRAATDHPSDLDWIADAVDRNSRSELAALKANAELATGRADLMLTFEDTVPIDGSAKDAYDFVNEAQLWRERLPHVAAVSLREDSPGLQLLTMDTRTKDGSVHTTESVRVTFPNERIVYKQTRTPALMTIHTGLWTFRENDSGAVATSRHTVVLNEANITTVLGADAGVEQARAFVRTALSGNSTATLQLAREYAKARR